MERPTRGTTRIAKDRTIIVMLKERIMKELCPACKKKGQPLHLEGGDTVTTNSRDGYRIGFYTVSRCKGWVGETCPNCDYVLREYRD